MTRIITSPLRYPGGKSRAINFLMDYIPEFKEYREPFIGGASIFLAVKQKFPTPDKHYYINDLYFEVYNFWKVCQDYPSFPSPLIQEIRNLKHKFENRGRELFQFLSMNRSSTFADIQRAAAFFILNRSSFSGMSAGYSDDAYNNRFTDSSIDNLQDLITSDLLTNVEITNLDYQKIIEMKTEETLTPENVFVFCDPPYFNVHSAKLYGKNGQLHQWFDHERFAKVMRNCPYRFLITYDDSNKVRQLFNWANIIEYDLVYGMGNTKSINNTNGKTKLGKELLISNFDLNKIKSKSYHSNQLSICEAWS